MAMCVSHYCREHVDGSVHEATIAREHVDGSVREATIAREHVDCRTCT